MKVMVYETVSVVGNSSFDQLVKEYDFKELKDIFGKVIGKSAEEGGTFGGLSKEEQEIIGSSLDNLMGELYDTIIKVAIKEQTASTLMSLINKLGGE